MDNLLLLFRQLADVDKQITLFANYSGIQATVENMYRHRRKVIKKIVRLQIRNFNRE